MNTEIHIIPTPPVWSKNPYYSLCGISIKNNIKALYVWKERDQIYYHADSTCEACILMAFHNNYLPMK